MYHYMSLETVADKKFEKGNFAANPVADLLHDGDSLSATTFPNAADA
jgi:hypothetical protein